MKELIWVRVQYASRQQCCKTHKRPFSYEIKKRNINSTVVMTGEEIHAVLLVISLFIFIVAFEIMLVRNMIRFGIHRLCLSRDILKYGFGISVDSISLTNPQQYKLSHVFESLCLIQTSLPILALSCS